MILWMMLIIWKLKEKNFLEFKDDFTKKNFKNVIIKNMWDVLQSEKISTNIVYDLFDGVESDLKK